MFDFSGRVVIVTGVGGNLGNAAAAKFYGAGANVVLVYREGASSPEPFVNESRVLAVPADLTRPDSVGRMVGQALERFDQIDIVANTVGGYRAGMPVHETPLDTWEFMFDLNARTALVLSQAVVPHMLARQYGKIIHTSARGGLSGGARVAAYSAAKSAVIRLTESLAAELRQQGINVNCILPGTIDTPENRAEMPKADFSRWVTPEAIADVILFLASDAARAIHGAALPVYGLS